MSSFLPVTTDASLPDATLRPTLPHLCAAPAETLESIDVGLVSLICAGGLPHSESIDIERAMKWLDTAAEKVELEIRRHWYRFNASPATFNNSPGYYCCY